MKTQAFVIAAALLAATGCDKQQNLGANRDMAARIDAATPDRRTADASTSSGEARTLDGAVDAQPPAEMADAATAPDATPPSVLASGQISPFGIAADLNNVYWTDDTFPGTVMQMPIAGGAPIALASGRLDPYQVAIDAKNVYWTDVGTGTNGSVQQVPIGGGTIVMLASGEGAPKGIAVGSSRVYWTDYGSGLVRAAPIGGGTAATLASGESSPLGIAVDAKNVYWLDLGSQELLSVPLAGSTENVVAQNLFATSGWFAIDAMYAYVTGLSSSAPGIVQCPLGGSPIGCSPLSTRASGSVIGIAVDTTSSTVYYTDSAGEIGFASTLISSSGILATGQSGPAMIALGVNRAFWTNNTGGTIASTAR